MSRFLRWMHEPIPSARLTFFRVFYVLCIAYSIFVYARGYDLHFQYASVPEGTAWFDSLALFRALRAFTVAMLLLSAVWLTQRWSVAAAWISFALYELQVAPALLPYTTNIAFFALFALAFAPRTGRGRDISGWPLRLIHLALAAAYFSAALTKLRLGGAGWLDGSLVASHLQENVLYTRSAAAAWVSQIPALVTALGIATIAFEGLFFLSLFSARAALAAAVLGLGFHLGIFALMQINFFHFFVPAYAALLRLDTIFRRV